MKPFDDQFADNLREVFDAWDEPVDEQAWQQMKARLQPAGKKSVRRIFPVWLRLAAAVFILGVLGVSAWLLFLPDQHHRQLADSVSISDTTQDTVLQYAKDSYRTDQEPSEIPPAEIVPPLARTEPAKAMYARPEPPASESLPPPDMAVVETADQEAPGLWFVEQVDRQEEMAETFPVLESVAKEETVVQKMHTPAPTHPALAMHENLADMFNGEESRDRHSPTWELSAGTLVTWSGAEMMGGMGLAAGVDRQWALGQRLSISSGGSLIYSQFNIDEVGYEQLDKSLYDADAFREFNSIQEVNVIDSRVNTDFEFLALEWPLNVRYTLHQMRHGSIYVSTGISSLVYLQQSYQSQFDWLAQVSGTGEQGEQLSYTNNATLTHSDDFGVFSRVDFARFLNLSAGYVINRRGHSLVIEPYLKYPTGGVTSLDFQISMTGISLKYRPEFP